MSNEISHDLAATSANPTQTSTFLTAMAVGRVQLNFLSAVDWEILAELLNFFSKKILVDLFRYDPVVLINDFIIRRRSMRHLRKLLDNSYKIEHYYS